MIAAVMSLHQCLGPDQFDAEIQAFGKTEISMAHTSVTQIQRIGLSEDDLGETFGYLHLKDGFIVLDDLTYYGLTDTAVHFPKRTREGFHRIDPGRQSFPKSHVFSMTCLFQ